MNTLFAPRPFLWPLRILGLLFCGALSSLAQGDPENIRLNEVDPDTPGTDDREFVELYGDPNTPLDGFVLVFFNGNGDTSYFAIDLDGAVTNAQGFYVVGNSGVENVGITFPNNTLQNGADAVALYLANGTDFPNGTPVTTTNIQDVLVYNSSPSQDTGLLTGLQPGATPLIQVNEDAGGNKVNESMARLPDGGISFDASNYANVIPTPGVTNVISLEITLIPSPSNISESGATTTSLVTIELEAASMSNLTVTLASSDTSELSLPAEILIPAGSMTATFTATAVNDAWPDGDQFVFVTANAVGYLEGSTGITVQDDGDSDPGLVINEIYASVDSVSGDANNDGTAGASDGSDEFVELVNTSGSVFDLSGFTLSDSATVRHQFPGGTRLDPGCAIVVFGGGNLNEGRLAAFGGAIIQKANGSNTFGLSLNDAGDLVSIRNPAGSGGLEVAGHAFGMSGSTFGGVTSSLGSFSRNPDITGSFELGPHTAGFRRDFSLFCPLPPQIMMLLSANPVLENAGSVALQITVSPAPATNLSIALTSNRPAAASVPATAMISASGTTTTVNVSVINNAFQNGAAEVTLSADAAGYLSAATVLTINDEGDPFPTIAINEVDYDPVGADDAGKEFVEIYDGGAGNVALDGYVLVFYNGNANAPSPVDGEYRIIDLSGQQTDANGFYVVTTPQDGIQNGGTGGDAIALYRGVPAAEFSGTVPGGAPAGAILVDALVYEAGDGNLIAPLNYTGPDLTDAGSADGISRVPDGTGTFQLKALTRGYSNDGGNATGYVTWASAFPGLGGPMVDSEFDGLANLLEYLLGKNPTVSDPLPALVPTRNGNGRPQVRIAKGAAAGADPLLMARVEVSASLATGSWTTAGTNVITDDANALVVEYTGASPVIFMRVVATYP